MDVMQQAMEVFARGFAFTRSFTHPYLPERVGDLWVVRDGPRKKGDFRREEWIAQGVTPRKVVQAAHKRARGHYCICAIYGVDEDDAPLREGYKALDYRLGGTEIFMVNELGRIPRPKAPVDIVRVLDEELAGRVNKAARAKQILPEHLVAEAPLRCYAGLVDGAPVGWVSSVDLDGMSWCSNMYVTAEYRCRGIGRALMAKMLRDDRKYGSQLAVLTASHTGALLYPCVGYREIGTLLVYTPKKR